MDNSAPVMKIAKAIADSGRSFITEHELTEKIFEYAQHDRRPNESEAQAFARHFAGPSPEALMFRKAVAVAKSAAARPDSDDDEAAARAYRALQRMADRLRARHPNLSEAQSFERVFTDPMNKRFADQAHQRPFPAWGRPEPE